MKIGIFTFHYSLNCGAALQAWALQTYLQRQGLDARIVNYGSIGWASNYYLRTDSLRHFLGSLYSDFFTFFRTFAIESYRRHLYRRFHRECMSLGPAVKASDLEKGGYTHLITGSDQVWHPIINEGDSMYFLNGVPDGVRRISYAPSFGVDTFDTELEKKMGEWLKRFDAISVREPQGADIVRRLSGREAQVVCDPTLLLNVRDYEDIERKPRFGLPEKYVAVYTICGHTWAEKAAIEVGRKLGLPVVHLLGGQSARWYFGGPVKRISALGPAEWIWFIHHAECVVTNSFHGTVFSLLFHRPFWVALNEKASDARMRTLLDGVGIEDRLCSTSEDLEVEALLNWQDIDSNLKKIFMSGKLFLTNKEVFV